MSRIKVEFIWDEKTLLDSFEAIYEWEYKNSKKRFIGWIFIALLQLGVVSVFKRGDISLLLFSTIVLVYWYYGKKYIAKKRALKEFYKDPLKDKKITLEFFDDKFFIDGKEFSYDDIWQVKEIEKGFLFLTKTKHFFLPFKAFESLEQRNEFKKLLKSKNKLS